jgi:phytoene dehydrogenase-like protein
MSEAVVVGAGPNGLACAATLAKNGVAVTLIEAAERIGGGTRSSELTVPGLLHDECSASHPLVLGSAAAAELELERHGLEWAWPEVDLAHPLDGGEVVTMVRSLADTVSGLGEEGGSWERLFGGPSRSFDRLCEDILRPVQHLPRHPLLLTSFGLRAMLPATALARALGGESSRALFAGVAAHGYAPFGQPFSAAPGMALVCACHRFGWPVAKGGSVAIAEAMATVVLENGGRIETGRPVSSLAELPAADAVILDLSPGAVADLAGERLPPRVARAYRRYRHGPGAFKLDLAVEGGVPWSAEAAKSAGSVHLGGGFAEIAATEREVNRGRMPERPFVLVGQQYLADPSRSAGNVHPVWTYAHVPSGYPGDASEAILDQIERFAPGTRERVVASASRSAPEFAAYNRNYVGGDIIGGANGVLQTTIRPRFALDPYATGAPGLYICSASTPPGAGAHGMGGYGAALSALRSL